MKDSRRQFLKIAGVSAIGVGAGPVLNAFASAGEKKAEAPKKAAAPVEEDPRFKKNPMALKGDHWAMVIDLRKFDAQTSEKLQKVCHAIHNVPEMPNKRHEIKWIWGTEFQHAFTMQENEFLADKFKHLPIPVLCNHCENPPCVQACPTKATFQREDGIVLMDFHRCIGCRFCMAACPYGSRSFNFQDPRPYVKDVDPTFPTRMKGVVEKCNFCAERLAKGQLPKCVEASKGAILFGDLSDPESEVRKALKNNYTIRRKPNLGTGPSVYYIV